MPEYETQDGNLIDGTAVATVNTNFSGEPTNVTARLVSVQTNAQGFLPPRTVLYDHGSFFSAASGNASSATTAILCRYIEHLDAEGEPAAGIVGNVPVIIMSE